MLKYYILLLVQFKLLLISSLYSVYAQWWVWTSIVELAPGGELLFGSLYYLPLLVLPTICWWARVLVCKIENWPMPRITGIILLVAWAPVTFIPLVALTQVLLMFATLKKMLEARNA